MSGSFDADEKDDDPNKSKDRSSSKANEETKELHSSLAEFIPQVQFNKNLFIYLFAIPCLIAIPAMFLPGVWWGLIPLLYYGGIWLWILIWPGKENKLGISSPKINEFFDVKRTEYLLPAWVTPFLLISNTYVMVLIFLVTIRMQEIDRGWSRGCVKRQVDLVEDLKGSRVSSNVDGISLPGYPDSCLLQTICSFSYLPLLGFTFWISFGFTSKLTEETTDQMDEKRKEFQKLWPRSEIMRQKHTQRIKTEMVEFFFILIFHR